MSTPGVPTDGKLLVGVATGTSVKDDMVSTETLILLFFSNVFLANTQIKKL